MNQIKSSELSYAGDIQVPSIAERFSAAAHHYQDHNKLQRLSAASLLDGFIATGNLLDIGAGPGTRFEFPQAAISKPKVFALDIALGMLKKLKQTYPHYQSICADAAQLPWVRVLWIASTPILHCNGVRIFRLWLPKWRGC